MSEESIETLKPLDQLVKEDFRNTILSYQNPISGEWRRQEAKDLHQLAAHAKLGDHVDGKIRSHFAMAQNLAVYAWFYYPFHMASQLHAFSTLEFALREVLKPKDRTQASFFGMLRRVANGKLVTDSGMVLCPPPPSREGKFQALVMAKGPDGIRRQEIQWFDHWVDTLPHYLPTRRNDLAHGSTTLWEDPTFLWICADLINQLYNPKKDVPAQTAS